MPSQTYEVIFEDSTKIVTTIDHKFLCDGDSTMLRDLMIGDFVDTIDGKKKIISIKRL